LNGLRKQFDEAETTITDLRQHRDRAEERADRAERRLEVLQAAFDAKSRELAAMKLTEPTSPPASALLVQLADKDEVIDDLRWRLDEKRVKLTAAQVEAAEVRGRLAALETERTSRRGGDRGGPGGGAEL
jgi:chromosome segregation ATPase